MKVVPIRDFQKDRDLDVYKAKIITMDHHDLLCEMVKFQEELSLLGYLSHKMMVEGVVLFKELSDRAQTNELRLLTRFYYRHLEYELAGNHD
jgi:hypothetical protein